jgi:FemAB-related protein (PEP-CTERM system-associated)
MAESAEQIPTTTILAPPVEIRVHDGRSVADQIDRLEAFVLRGGPMVPLSQHPGCAAALARGLRHSPYWLEAVEEGRTRGFLPLAYIRGMLFGRFLVSLPYLNYGGVLADNEAIAGRLIDHAVRLADQLGVRYLELRHAHAAAHPALAHVRTDKVNMRLDLPGTPEKLLAQLDGKVRNQVRKGEKNGLSVSWGGGELLPSFYGVFSHNMRDLGTPVYGKRLFRAILNQFPQRAEICVVRAGDQPVAAAFVLHGWGVSEVPSASSLRRYNHTCANMLMYWHLLRRAIERGQDVFDFGRSSKDSNTHRFKKQWGAAPAPADWQYHIRAGNLDDMRNDNPRFQHLIRMWQFLPVRLTRWLGPAIVRGIP